MLQVELLSYSANFPRQRKKTNKRPGRGEQMMHVNGLVLRESRPAGAGPELRH